jgi:hypothetical protein
MDGYIGVCGVVIPPDPPPEPDDDGPDTENCRGCHVP